MIPLFLLLYACAESPCLNGEQLCDTQCIPPIESNVESLYENVFSKSCSFSSCHGESEAAQLRFDSVDDITAMINQPSSQIPQRLLIAPGAPEESYLMHKLYGENLASGTDPMPLGVPLCESKISRISDWITDL